MGFRKNFRTFAHFDVNPGSGHAKVGDFQRFILSDQNISSSQVSMNYIQRFKTGLKLSIFQRKPIGAKVIILNKC